MPLYKCQVTLNMTDGLAENAATNTWYFDATSTTTLEDASIALGDWYRATDLLLSSLVDEDNVLRTFYDMADPEPRAPVKEGLINALTVATSAAPTEVALVMAYQAVKVAGLPQARRRGRVYLGPLGDNVFDATGRVPPGTVQVVRDAGAALLAASNAASDWSWVQYSSVGQEATPVVNGWVDNEWDTQRRRGRKASVRSTF